MIHLSWYLFAEKALDLCTKGVRSHVSSPYSRLRLLPTPKGRNRSTGLTRHDPTPAIFSLYISTTASATLLSFPHSELISSPFSLPLLPTHLHLQVDKLAGPPPPLARPINALSSALITMCSGGTWWEGNKEGCCWCTLHGLLVRSDMKHARTGDHPLSNRCSFTRRQPYGYVL